MIKILYLIGALIMTVLILLIAFENVQAYCNYLFVFFYQVNSQITPTFLILGVAFIGAIAGFFYTSLLWSMLRGKDDDEEYESESKKDSDNNNF